MTNPTDDTRDGARTLSLREAQQAGYTLTVYCSSSCRKGRPLDLTKVGERLLDQPIAELVERRAFRCRSCGSKGPISVFVYRQQVGVDVRIASFEQQG